MASIAAQDAAHGNQDGAALDPRDVHGEHPVVPVSLYLKVFTALMALLILTLAVAMFNLPGPGNIIVAMTVAVIKATLIMLYFMHVRWSSRLTWLFAGAGIVWLMILFSITFSDYFSRSYLPQPGISLH